LFPYDVHTTEKVQSNMKALLVIIKDLGSHGNSNCLLRNLHYFWMYDTHNEMKKNAVTYVYQQ